MSLHKLSDADRQGNHTTLGLRDHASLLSEVLTDDEGMAHKENQPNSDLKNLEASFIQSPTIPNNDTVRISTKSMSVTPIDRDQDSKAKTNE